MLTKYIDGDAYLVTPAHAKHCNGSCDWLQKEASVTPESVHFFDNLKPKPDHVYLLTIAMTAGEFFGANKNGDYFREQDLKKYYKDFKGAGVFWNHDNKDMSKSSGKVIEAFYNEHMHRVELIIEFHKDKARYIPSYIKDKKPIAVSMGLKTSSEVCCICGNVTRNSYATRCSHLKYQMNQVLDDGRKVYAISNTPLKIFDISVVFNPADRTAYTLYTKSGT